MNAATPAPAPVSPSVKAAAIARYWAEQSRAIRAVETFLKTGVTI